MVSWDDNKDVYKWQFQNLVWRQNQQNSLVEWIWEIKEDQGQLQGSVPELLGKL